ncbi:MAG: diguanylate cyclase, partial [Cyanobacteria bacterium P01_H01_bin.121]
QKRDREALEKANFELERLANLDGLTQVANRRRFDSYLNNEWLRLRREHAPLALILCDIDHFKRLNDRHGHQVGDTCLLRLAQTLQSLIHRPADLVTRYGGEEFAVILPNTQALGAKQVANRIRQAVQTMQLADEQDAPIESSITVSIGVASTIPSSDRSPEQLFARADQALYEAKRQGRNRVVICAESLTPTP